MATVLVLGSTGYIGNAVARAFRRDGYKVYGVTRSAAKADGLAAAEIVPLVVEDINNTDAYIGAIGEADVIVNCASDYSFAIEGKLLAAAAATQTTNSTRRKLFIETSGCLCHGHNEATVTEATPDVPTGVPVLEARVAIEKTILTSTAVDGVVLRPGFVYGGNGGQLVSFGAPVPEGEKLVVDGKKDKRWSWVHVDDLAEAYLLAANNRGNAAGQLFSIGEGDGPTYEALLRTLKGYDGEVEYKAAEGFGLFFDRTTVVNSNKARRLLGWTPKHVGLLAELDLYAAAMAANQKIAAAVKAASGAGAGAGAGSS